jgi:hypothetical protein
VPFWLRLAPAETWPELDSAAMQRFWDGLVLATAGDSHAGGAVYPFGYVAEMLLKTAYFRERGVSRHVDTSGSRRDARRFASGYGRRANDHDLNYWVFVLERVRHANNRPIAPAFLGALKLRVGFIASNWSESLRYRDAQPTEQELHEMFSHVEWILEHRRRLWR